MSLNKSLSEDLAHEATIARRLLEMVPEEHLDWKPVENALSVSQLASHVARIIGWIGPIMTRDGWDLEQETLPGSTESLGLKALLVEFGTGVGDFHQALRVASEADLEAAWTLRRGEMVIEKMTRAKAIHRFILSHLAHHCGQLSVYLWMLNVQVPKIYRPTDDHRDHTVKESQYNRQPYAVAAAL